MNDGLSMRFKSHTMTEDAKRKSKIIRDSVGVLADNIDIFCSDSRERSLALTKLEECLFWCNADLARNQ